MKDISLSIASPSAASPLQKAGAALTACAILCSIIAAFGAGKSHPLLFFFLITGLFISGGIFYSIPYFKAQAGIKNDGIMQNSLSSRGAIAWGIAILNDRILYHPLLVSLLSGRSDPDHGSIEYYAER
jgi:hypothetical protein